jgi:P-type Ca2+ transporter type 2C
MIKTNRIPWEHYSKVEIERRLNTRLEHGLDGSVIETQQRRYGKNILRKENELGIVWKVLKQFKNPLVYILLGAGILTLFFREFLDTIVIFAALLINVVVGTFQEERASRAFEKLNKSQEKHATVIRDGKKTLILSEELVPGDIVVIDGGSYVPADMRLINVRNLSINEAALTGEWVPVSKEAKELDGKNIPLSKRVNMAWMGTLVSSGYGSGVVVDTGERTQVGIIARQLGTVGEHLTPLQASIRKLARFLIYIIAAAIAAIIALGILRGEPFGEMLLIAIAVAVATMPEGLPAAVTVVLALGMESILKRGGLVRNLLAAETLGATTVILTDKTGTLTEAKMKLKTLYTFDSIRRESNKWSDDDKELLAMGVLASDAFVEEALNEDLKTPEGLVVHGRPIEKAIVLSGLENGISQDDLYKSRARMDFMQFEPQRRFGASLNKHPGHKRNRFYLSGMPEFLLSNAMYVYKEGIQSELTERERMLFNSVLDRESRKGLRIIGISYKDVDWEDIPAGKHERDILTNRTTFAGFIVFEDPIRSDVKESIAKVRRAGAHVIMLTGDNAETARTVAIEVGIAGKRETVYLGSDIEMWSDQKLFDSLKNAHIFARVLPSHKLRIARVLKSKNEVVAMTGDGVNDAPALQSASIGIAVGSGTEVAKEASDIILLNNSFSIIVSAIEEGRKIIDNLKKITSYLLSTSFSEIFVIVGALVAGAPLPLLPTQILWTNIVSEGLMSFPFAFEKKEPGIMEKDPRSHVAKGILTTKLKKLIIVIGVITGLLLTALYFVLLRVGMPIDEIRTFIFVALSVASISFAFSLKSFDMPIWRINILSNPYLVGSLAISIILLVGAITISPLRTLLSLTTLSFNEVLFLFGIGAFNLLTIEISKYFLFERRK